MTLSPEAAELARQNGKLGGRPKGNMTIATRLFHQRVSALHRSGDTPGDIMADNMIYWHRKAGEIERVLRGLLAKPLGSIEVRQKVVDLIGLYARARDKSQSCAVDAAPYFHPKLQSIAFSNTSEPGVDDLLALPDEKLAEIVQRGMTAALAKRDQGMINVTPKQG